MGRADRAVSDIASGRGPERDPLAVQALLGHASMATPQIYAQVPQGAMLAAVRNAV